jgi:hypothetical protein
MAADPRRGTDRRGIDERGADQRGVARRGADPRGVQTWAVTRARERPAFYALRPGGWRDYWTLLHPPYTLWHLSYVALGAVTAPGFEPLRLAAALVAFLLAVGVSAHALDELRGRPLRTGIPSWTLWTLAWVALAGSLALGVAGAATVSWWLLAFVATGTFFVLAYNLELLEGRFHSDFWFAASWGAFPALTGAFAQDGRIHPAAVAVAVACMLLSLAQRTLSTPVRLLRRHLAAVHGRIVLDDGREVELSDEALRAAPEGALRAMALALTLLAAGLVVARLQMG